MKHITAQLTTSLMIVALLAACTQGVERQNGEIRKQDIGIAAGAIGGAFAGSTLGKGSGRTLGIAAGALLGGLIGSEIGASLDRADRLYMERSAQSSLESAPTGETRNWVNPDTGNAGTITPKRTYQQASGEYCREYTQTVTVGGKTSEAFGHACRMPDGAWQIQQ